MSISKLDLFGLPAFQLEVNMASGVRILSFVTVILLLLTISVYGKPSDRKAFLRTRTQPTGVEYYIEISTDVPLNQALYDQLNEHPSAPHPEIGSVFVDGDPLTIDYSDLVDSRYPRNKIVVSPNDNAKSRKLFRVYLKGENPFTGFGEKNYTINLFDYADDSNKQARQIIKVSTWYERTVLADDIVCPKEEQFAAIYKYEVDDPDSLARLSLLYDWFVNLKSKGNLGKLLIEVEQLDRKGKRDLRVIDLAIFDRTKIKAMSKKRFHVCLDTNQSLPAGKFDARLTFADAAPAELFEPGLIVGLKGAPNEASPGVFSDESAKNVGERPLDKNLNIAGSLTSSVNDNEKEDAAKNKFIVRERTTRATLDLRLIPKFFYTLKTEDKDDHTNGSYREWIPFFLDLKNSTGKIDKDTLSLNRTVFGTKVEQRWLPRLDKFSSYYRLIGGFLHASDRDFKQGEYKGIVEFRPVFGALNHPLASQIESERKILDPTSKAPIKIIPKSFGFEIVPFVGAELGRTYFRRRPAQAVQPSDTVRRIYVGMDLTLNPVRFLTISVSNTLYVRAKAESETTRYRNYFSGKLELPLGEPTRTPHSIFFSFERGDQPPFKELGVNALKFGYRLRSDWFGLFH